MLLIFGVGVGVCGVGVGGTCDGGIGGVYDVDGRVGVGSADVAAAATTGADVAPVTDASVAFARR